MADPESNVEQVSTPQPSKEELEIQKIQLEIKDLERPFWKRPVYVLAALPTLLAVVTLTVGFINGYFSAAFTKLENQKRDLQLEIKDFEAKRDKLGLENEQLKKENESVEEKIATIKKGYDVQLVELDKRRGELQSVYEKLNTEFETLKKKHGELTKNTKDLTDQKNYLSSKLAETKNSLNNIFTLIRELADADISSMSKEKKDKFAQLQALARRIRIRDLLLSSSDI